MTTLKKVKSSNWIDNDFGFDDFGGSNSLDGSDFFSKSRKRSRDAIAKPPKEINAKPLTNRNFGKRRVLDGELWIDRHHPTNPDDLAVHVKKVDEVTAWIKNNRCGILLLSGPAGSGKTATVRAVAEKFEVDVQEWVNPVEQVEYDKKGLVEDEYFTPNDTVTFTNKTKQFKDWLRTAKYTGLTLGDDHGHNKKLILIEDLPNYVFSKTPEFHDLLEQYTRAKQNVPLVFVISESAKAKSSVRTLFPAELVEKLKIAVINFNPVATTNMVKALIKIATSESLNGVRNFSVPDKMTLTNLVESTGGDIRAAINALQFSCLNKTNDLNKAFEGYSSVASSKAESKSTLKKSKKKTQTDLASIGGKDPSLQMFHALGKVLYAKREDGPLEDAKLPPHLQKLARKPLKANPDEIIEKTTLSADAFTCFLHQNYLPFYSDINDVVRCSENFSHADLFLKEWGVAGKMNVSEYGGILAARATMFCNTQPAQVSGMRKLNKPQHYGVVRSQKSLLYGVQRAISTVSLPMKELTTITVPLLARIRPREIGVSQQHALAEVGTFPGIKHCGLKATDTLDANDVFTEEQEGDEVEKVVAATDELPPVLEDEDFVIEEFDD